MRTPGELLHVTLTTGHVRRSPRAEVTAEAIEAVRPLLHEGGRLPRPCDGYTVSWREYGTAAARFAVRRRKDRAALILCGIVAEAGEIERRLWSDLREAAGGAVLAERPAAVPWLGVVLFPRALAFDPEAVSWLGDFERCVAWAWLEKRSATEVEHERP